MTVAHVCVALAIASSYVFTTIAKRTLPGFVFTPNPRESLEQLGGSSKRAHYAQLNSFETVPAFSAAVLVAEQVGTAARSTIDALAVVFVLSRLVYGVVYVGDRPTVRSLVWFAGMACIAGLFVASF